MQAIEIFNLKQRFCDTKSAISDRKVVCDLDIYIYIYIYGLKVSE